MSNFFLRSRPTVMWLANAVHALGVRRLSTGTVPALGIHFEVTAAGTTGAAEPMWNTTVGGTTTDNTVTWTTRGSANTWVAATAYVAGDRVVATAAASAADNVLVQECTTGGTSGASEPDWNNTVAGTTTDNTVTWTTRAATTWDNAHIFIARFTASATSSVAAGDTLFVGDEHLEVTAASIVISLRGTGASPCRVLCVQDTGDPASPVTLATSGQITTTGSSSITISAVGTAVINGLVFKAGSGAVSASIMIFTDATTSSFCKLQNCALILNGTASADIQLFGAGAATGRKVIVWENTTVQFTAADSLIELNHGHFLWKNTANAHSGAIPTFQLLDPITLGIGTITLEGVGFPSLTSGTLFDRSVGSFKVLMRNCSTGGAAFTTGTHPGVFGSDVAIINVDSAATRTQFEYTSNAGQLTEELTIVRTGGANNGQEAFAWKAVTNANSAYDNALVSFPIRLWNTGVGVLKTATVQIISSTTLTDAQVWAELEFLGSSTVPLSTFSNDAAATTLTAGVNQPLSAAVWASSPATPVKQTLDVTFTPQMIGFVTVRVNIAVASTTLYIDPFITVV